MKTVEGLSIDEARAAAIFRAIGNPARVRILRALAENPGCVTGELVGILPLAQSTVSEHLRVLKEAGVVRGTIDGDRCYCLDSETLAEVVQFCTELQDSARACATGECC